MSSGDNKLKRTRNENSTSSSNEYGPSSNLPLTSLYLEMCRNPRLFTDMANATEQKIQRRSLRSLTIYPQKDRATFIDWSYIKTSSIAATPPITPVPISHNEYVYLGEMAEVDEQNESFQHSTYHSVPPIWYHSHQLVPSFPVFGPGPVFIPMEHLPIEQVKAAHLSKCKGSGHYGDPIFSELRELNSRLPEPSWPLIEQNNDRETRLSGNFIPYAQTHCSNSIQQH